MGHLPPHKYGSNSDACTPPRSFEPTNNRANEKPFLSLHLCFARPDTSVCDIPSHVACHREWKSELYLLPMCCLLRLCVDYYN
mmetsp:Transcript_19944/g.39478  ORF Transcript_19944/g.39478 Transcript_19944/m.39478 type:complete len:83 (-) Transcript_19944:1555-1803(-)